MPWPWCLYYPHGVTGIKLGIKDTTERVKSASCLHIEIDSEDWINIQTDKHLWQRYYLNFPIVNFPFISSNIPAADSYGVYNSQLIPYSRACGSYTRQ
jgi:hypothetical protein